MQLSCAQSFVNGRVWDSEDCSALVWRFRACIVGQPPIRSYGADRIRYDLPVGETLKSKIQLAFPGTKGVESTGHIYSTSTKYATNAVEPHWYTSRKIATDKGETVDTTHNILVFLAVPASGGLHHFQGVTVAPITGTAVKFCHGVTLHSDAVTEGECIIMLLRSW